MIIVASCPECGASVVVDSWIAEDTMFALCADCAFEAQAIDALEVSS